MIFEHQWGNTAAEPESLVEIGFDVRNDIDTTDTVSAVTASCFDENGTEVGSTHINTTSVTSPIAYVIFQNGVAGKSYELKYKITTSAGRVILRRVSIDIFGNVNLNPKLGDAGANTYVNLKEANDYIKSNFYHPNQWDNLTFEGRKRLLIHAAKDIDALNYKNGPYFESQPLVFPRDDHEVYTGNASAGTTTTFRGTNLYSSAYNKIPDNYFKYGTVHIKTGGHPRTTRYIASSLATPSGGYGQITVSSAFSSSVVASDNYVVFKPIDREVKEAQCEQAMWIVENKFYRYPDYQGVGIVDMTTADLRVTFSDPKGNIPSKVSPKARRLLGRYMRKTIRTGRA